ncbi:MAG: ATP-binding protein [bacterium]|nr:ATP-binding protein [bacterium]MDT8367089.1 ATP-binding protein [bacterium]
MFKFSWPRKIFLYSVVLAVTSVSLTALATVRTAAHLWEQEFLTRNTSYSRYTSLDVLRTFGGRFSGGADPEVTAAIHNLTRSNQDLIGVQILTESGRVLFSTPHMQDGTKVAPGAAPGPGIEPTPGQISEPISEPFSAGAWYEGKDKAVQAVIGSSHPMARTFKAGGQRYLDVLAPVTGFGGSRPIAIRYLYAYTSLEAKTDNLVQRVILVALVLMLLVAGLSVYLSRALTRPVSLLSASARRIAEGDLEHRIRLTTGDEIEELSRQFNQMLESLAQHRRDIEEANRELREANSKLKELQAQLVRSERLAALGQLSAGVSHELDNPVGVILGYAELTMEESDPGSQLHEYAVVVREEAKRCKRIIAGLLDFSRPSIGVAQDLDLKALIVDLVKHLEDQRLFKRISWNLELEDRDTVVNVDPDSMRQVLVNLALNAAQAMGDEGVITVSLQKTIGSAEDGYLIHFEDSGEGVPLGGEERIFDPFYTTKRRGEGTGLGLSICRKLVEEMGGRIKALSGPTGVFEIWLPRTGEPYDGVIEEPENE